MPKECLKTSGSSNRTDEHVIPKYVFNDKGNDNLMKIIWINRQKTLMTTILTTMVTINSEEFD